MKAMIYAVYDAKAEVYSQPHFLLNRGTAFRAWEEAANDNSTQIGKYPADFTMFEIGEWDDQTGTITMLKAKISLGTALELKKQTQSPGLKMTEAMQDTLNSNEQ